MTVCFFAVNLIYSFTAAVVYVLIFVHLQKFLFTFKVAFMLPVKSFVPLLFSLAFFTSGHAATITNIIPWDSEDSSTSIFYETAASTNTLLFSVSIDHSKEGAQRLYFVSDSDFTTVANASVNLPPGMRALIDYTDSQSNSNPSSTVIVFNGQAIKMLRFTKKYADTRNIYFSYTPETEAGHLYLLNLFKKSKSPIEVNFGGEKLYIPVRGFTKIWNSYGGDAI